MRITLAEAESRATDNPLARVAELQINADRNHRQQAEANYFPKIGSTFVNMHFKKSSEKVSVGPTVSRSSSDEEGPDDGRFHGRSTALADLQDQGSRGYWTKSLTIEF